MYSVSPKDRSYHSYRLIWPHFIGTGFRVIGRSRGEVGRFTASHNSDETRPVEMRSDEVR